MSQSETSSAFNSHATCPAGQPPQRVMYLIWSLDLGGAEQVVMNLVKSIDRSCFEPVICCLNEKGRYGQEIEVLGVKVIAMRKLPKFDPFLLPRLIYILKREKIDLLHTHLFTANLWGRLAAALAGVPSVSTEHNIDVWKKSWHYMVDRWLLRFTRQMIFVSRKVKEFYERKLGSLEGKGRVIYNGIDTIRFHLRRTPVLRDRLGIAKDITVLGTVGRLVPQKSQVDFLEAISFLKDEGKHVMGMIVGEGPLRAELEKIANETGLGQSVIFTGFTDDLAPYYHAMDLFVLSSMREGFPMTILEAMASGTPVVSTDVGGVAECIQDGIDGFLVPPGDTEVMSDTVSKLIDDPELAARIVKNAREKVCGLFSMQKMARDHEALYREVLGQKTAGHRQKTTDHRLQTQMKGTDLGIEN